MVRVVHLLEQDADFQTRRCVEQLTSGLGEGFVCAAHTMGRGGDYRGLVDAVWRIRPDPTDLLHAWGAGALMVAAAATKGWIIYTLHERQTRKSLRLLNAVMAYRPVQVMCPTGTLQRMCLEHGVAPDRCHLIRPSVQFGKINKKRNPELRTALGFAPDDCVLLAVGESTREANHRLAAWTAAILNVLDGRSRVLLWGEGHFAEPIRRFTLRLRQRVFQAHQVLLQQGDASQVDRACRVLTQRDVHGLLGIGRAGGL